MNNYLPFNGIELWHIAGWTMLHYLWLGMLVAAAGALSRLVLRHASPNARYAAAIGWLLLLAILPVGIAAWLSGNVAPRQVAMTTRTPNARSPESLFDTAENDATANAADQGNIELSKPNTVSPYTQPAKIKEAVEPLTKVESTLAPVSTANRIQLATLESCVPYLPWLWIVGTPLTFALLAAGVVGTKRLRSASVAVHDPRINEILVRLVTSLRVTRRVTVAVCERIAAPVLIGILRPIILLPPAALTGWSPEEIEMVLLHELGHVRRWDNLVNFVQRIIESLLFFHPAVWLMSNWVRRERESCCDALVVTRTNRPHAYAELLVALAAQMPRSVLFHPAASSAMAAGPLRNRIRRILGLDEDPMLISGKSFALMLATLLVAATLALLYLPTIGQAEESTTESTESSEPKERVAESATASAPTASDDVDSTDVATLARNAEVELLLREIAQLQERRGELESQMYELQTNYAVTKANLVDQQDRDSLQSPNLPLQQMTKVFQLQFGALRKQFATVKKALDERRRKLARRLETSAELESRTAQEEGRPADDWPDDVAFPSPREREVSKRAFELLDLKIAPAPADEIRNAREMGYSCGLKILNMPARQLSGSHPVILVSLGRSPVSDFAELDSVITAIRRSRMHSGQAVVELGGVAGDREFKSIVPLRPLQEVRFEGGERLPGTTVGLPDAPSDKHDTSLPVTDDWPAGVVFPSPKEGEIAVRAWKELGLKFVPPIKEDFEETDQRGLRGGLKLVNYEHSPRFNPYIVTSIRTKTVTTGIGDYHDLERALDAIASQPPDEIVIIAGTAEDGVAFEFPLQRPLNFKDRPTRLSRFPSLEDQKLADLAWKRMKLELEPIGEEDLQRVRALGYDGGVKVVLATADALPQQESVLAHDILVGLHVWPTTSMKDVAEILNRDDLAELNPLKFYVVSNMAVEEKDNDVVRTGRISVAIDGGEFGGGSFIPRQQLEAMARAGIDRSAVSANAAPASDPDLPRYEVPSPEVEAVAPSKSQPTNPNPFAAAGPSKRAATNRADATRGAADGKENLRYDGKTFDEWRNAWQTELSTEKRIDAVKALAAFGRAGYGKEAAQAILDVVRQYDWQYLEGSSSSVGRLQELTIKAFAGTGEARLPREDALPVLTSAIKAGDKKAIDFAQYVVNYFGEDEQSRARLLELSRDDELKSIRSDILYRLGNIHQLNADPQIEKRMVEALGEGNAAARAAIIALWPQARSGMFFGLGGLKQALAEDRLEFRPELVEFLSDDDLEIRRVALDALGRLKTKAKPALPKIYPLILDDDGEIVERAFVAVAAIAGSPQAAVDYLHKVVSERGSSELLPLLLSKSDVAAKLGRQAASTIDEKAATQLVGQLLERQSTDASVDHIATIRALAAMGPKAQPAWDKLMELLASSDPKTRVAAATAIKMIVGKDQYQKPLADVLGKELGITVVKTASGAWGALPREDATDDGKAFTDFTEAVIKEQQELFLPDATDADQKSAPP